MDVIRDIKDNQYVLEINTAPGCSGTTLDRYLDYFTQGLINYVHLKEASLRSRIAVEAEEEW